MNNGNKIITILGIAAAVIFIITILVSMGAHYSTKKYHEARYEDFCRIAVTGSRYDDVKAKLADSGFMIMRQDRMMDGGKILIYAWAEREDAKRFQQKKLGVPVAVSLKVDAAGNVIACEGLMVRPDVAGEE